MKEDFNIINGTVGDLGDLYFAFYIDGVISKDMPQKGEGYTIDTEKTSCTNGASVEFNTSDWSIKVVNMTTSRTKCTLYFKKYIPTAAEFILSKGETEELRFDDTTDKNLRYIGANPNNYVSFNNELWRIIGVFNNINDGTGKKEARVKMIRKDPYGEDETNWDSEMINDWTQASLQEELNGTFLNSIQSPYKEMIGDALWNLGGMTKFYMGSSDGLASHWYTNERGTNVYTGRPTEWTGKIGLIYTSDYGYATSGGSTTDRTTCLNTAIYSWNDSSVNDCIDNDWLYFSDSYWFLTPASYNDMTVCNLTYRGSVFCVTANQFAYPYPSLYLDSNVKIISGDGSESNPFTLSL